MKLPEKKKLIIPGLIVLVLLGILIASVSQSAGTNGSTGENQTADGSGKQNANGTSGTDHGNQSGTEKEDGSDTDSYSQNMPTGEEWRDRISSSGLDSSNQPQSTEDGPVLPYRLPSTALQIEKLAGYTGIYIEDGSDEEIENVAAILLTNTGDEDVELVRITAETEGGSYSFQATSLPAGASVIVMDQNRTPFTEGKLKSFQATATDPAPFDLSEDQIEVVSSEGDEIVLKNITNKTIPTVRVFYKFYYPDRSAYVGGITYTAVIHDLEPGKTASIRPSHYSGEAGRIVMIRTYEDEE